MKNPLKPKLIPVLTLIAGAVGFLMRLWLLSTGIDRKGLLDTAHPANTLSFIVVAVFFAALLLCLRRTENKPYRGMFPPSLPSAIGYWIAALGVGITLVSERFSTMDLLAWASIAWGVLSVFALAIVGLRRLQGIRPNPIYHSLITLYLLLQLVCRYRQWSSETQLSVLFFRLMASVFLMLSTYCMATLDAKTGHAKHYLFTRCSALFFCMLTFQEQYPVFYISMAVWIVLSCCDFSVFSHEETMPLPEAVQFCLDKLNDAGFDAYVVGGCVRDSLLGLTPQDYDMCTNASPRQIGRVFSGFRQVRSGEKHGTIGVVIDGSVYEITTFRTEGGYSDRRHPDWVKFVSDVKEDLARRDFTVNAMAYSPISGYVDPYGGQKDLAEKVLRTVREPEARFTEDALRILRGARFAAKYQLTPHPETEEAMTRLAHTMDSLAQERVYAELCKLLVCATAEDLVRYAPVITAVIPELAPAVGFDQHSSHHCYDVYTHTAHVVENTPPELTLRWAALLHDTGKPETFTLDEEGHGHFYDHAAASAQIADAVLQRLRAPNALRQQVVFLVQQHMLFPELDKKLLRRRISKYGAEAMQRLLQLQKADFCSKGNDNQTRYFEELDAMVEEIQAEDACLSIRDLAIDGNDLMDLGFFGPAIGQTLSTLLEAVLDERIPNEKDALISAATTLKSTEDEA